MRNAVRAADPLTDELAEAILKRLPRLTVGVLGDLFLDRYLDIDAALTEPSIETGLDAYQVTRVRSYPGAVGTVVSNLAALGVGHIVPLSVIGDDGEGHELRQALHNMPIVDTNRIFNWDRRRTPTYTKPMLHRAGETPRELNRLDIKNRTPLPLGAEDLVLNGLNEAWEELDALVVLDQVSETDCGVVTRARARAHRGVGRGSAATAYPRRQPRTHRPFSADRPEAQPARMLDGGAGASAIGRRDAVGSTGGTAGVLYLRRGRDFAGRP